MKNVLALSVVALLLVCFSACSKCYTCTNACTVCTQQHPDTTFTIVFCSTTLSEQYYIEYLDSLNSVSLGWSCHDTTSTMTDKFCDQKSRSNGDIINKINEGWRCTTD